MLTAIIFILIISVLIFIHELGHFVMAKRAGMKVEEFGFGFPPRIFGVKKGETVYSINLIPFGGFVKIFGESGQDESNPRSFASKSAGARSKVIVAGVVMNILFAALLLIIGNIIGVRTGILENTKTAASDLRIYIVQVAAGSPAEAADIRTLDEIKGFYENGKVISVETSEEIQSYIQSHLGDTIYVQIRRGEQIILKQITPRQNPPSGEGALGISLAVTGITKYPWHQAIYRGITDTGIIAANVVIGYASIIKNFFIGSKIAADLSGPVGIATIAGQAAKVGFSYLLQFTALISVNLAVLNIIPFPALDGGRLLFIGIEKFRKKAVSKRIENAINTAGFALLILLMIYVTAKDISKFF